MYLTTIKTSTDKLEIESELEVYAKVDGNTLFIREYLKTGDYSLNSLKAIVSIEELVYIECNKKKAELQTGTTVLEPIKYDVEVDIEKVAKKIVDKLQKTKL